MCLALRNRTVVDKGIWTYDHIIVARIGDNLRLYESEALTEAREKPYHPERLPYSFKSAREDEMSGAEIVNLAFMYLALAF